MAFFKSLKFVMTYIKLSQEKKVKRKLQITQSSREGRFYRWFCLKQHHGDFLKEWNSPSNQGVSSIVKDTPVTMELVGAEYGPDTNQ
jgi:hypothetical protein